MPAVALLAAATEAAADSERRLRDRLEVVEPEAAEILIPLGGDGFMLQALHRYMHLNVPFFGMKCGSVGFLLNEFSLEGLPRRLATAKPTVLHPLSMNAVDRHGECHEALAFNEVSLLRQTGQAAKIGVFVSDVRKIEELICDGILLATAAGSTAYNLSAHGPILPIGSEVIALTPISPFRPRRWHGAILPHDVAVRFEILEADKRPVSATADAKEVRNVVQVEVVEDRSWAPVLLFDPHHNLEERILNEQFTF